MEFSILLSAGETHVMEARYFYSNIALGRIAMMQSAVVVLNGSGQYWGDRSLKDVMRLQANKKITTLIADETREIRAGIGRDGNAHRMPTPLVVMLRTFFGCTVEIGDLRFDPDLIYERDQNNCQYWHRDNMGRRFVYKCPPDERTIDHIVPKCRGGEDTYENCVCACVECNIRRKGRLTPKEAGLKLIKPPRPPKHRPGGWAYVKFEHKPGNVAHEAYVGFLRSLAS